MRLSDQQYAFAQDVHYLLGFILDHPRITKFSIGECWRQQEWQNILVEKGYSKTKNSRHVYKLAIDLYIWVDNVFMENKIKNKIKLQDIGNYWESLHQLNKWGGNYRSFCDLAHFERLRKY